MALPILSVENIKLNEKLSTKEEAIQLAGKILADRGYVQPEYIEKMLERETMTSTFMGNFVAIPHGTDDAEKRSKRVRYFYYSSSGWCRFWRW